eukprot:284593-Prymnesium_polylepis.1
MPLVDKSAAERRAARARGRPLFGEDTRHGHAAQRVEQAGRSAHGVERSAQKRQKNNSLYRVWG